MIDPKYRSYRYQVGIRTGSILIRLLLSNMKFYACIVVSQIILSFDIPGKHFFGLYFRKIYTNRVSKVFCRCLQSLSKFCHGFEQNNAKEKENKKHLYVRSLMMYQASIKSIVSVSESVSAVRALFTWIVTKYTVSHTSTLPFWGFSYPWCICSFWYDFFLPLNFLFICVDTAS